MTTLVFTHPDLPEKELWVILPDDNTEIRMEIHDQSTGELIETIKPSPSQLGGNDQSEGEGG